MPSVLCLLPADIWPLNKRLDSRALFMEIGPMTALTIELGRRLIDCMVRVTEDDIRSAIRFLHTHHGLVVKGSGAVGVAALLLDRWSMPDCKVGVVLTGGNLDADLLKQICADIP